MSGRTLAADLAERVRCGAFPAVAWWVGDASGCLDRGAVGQATAETPFDLASLTKPLATALLALKAEERGLWSLADPAGDWLEEWGGSPLAGRTLADLGSHRAGLPAWHPLYVEAEDLPGYLTAIAGLPVGEAGPELYSDLGYIALGAALERTTGKPLDRLFDAWIAEPLALRRLGFAVRGSFADAAPTERGNAFERALAGARGEGFPFRKELIQGAVHDVNAHRLGGVAGHAGLFGTADDVASLLAAVLEGDVIGERALSRWLAPLGGTGQRTFGLVLARGSSAACGALPDEAPGHTGFTGTSLWIEAGPRRIYVLLTNRVHPQVPESDFQPERLEFHRRAAGLFEAD